MNITTIGVDLAKNVFQLHGVDAAGQVAVRKRLRRAQVIPFFAKLAPCLVGLEACASAHYWARELTALGHTVKLMAPRYVRAYVKTNKHDAADAEAACEAVQRPTMRFVPIKTAESQARLMLHRTRELLVRQRTMLANALRGHLAEFGLVAPKGLARLSELRAIIADADDTRVPALAREALQLLVRQLDETNTRVAALEKKIVAAHRGDEASRRLAMVPGIGPLTASAIVASVGDGAQFKSARHFAAWLGLVPRQHSSGDTQRLGGISKRGNHYVRRLLIQGAHSVLRWHQRLGARPQPWLSALAARRCANVTAAALAHKNARVAWALLRHGRAYDPAYTRTPAAQAA
jgi:transposase